MVHNFGVYETSLFEGYEIIVCIKYGLSDFVSWLRKVLHSSGMYILPIDCRNMINVSEHGSWVVWQTGLSSI